MRIIDVPARSVVLPLKDMMGREAPKKYDFVDFLKDAIDSNQRFGKSLSNARVGNRLLELVDEMTPGQPFPMEDAEYEALKESVEGCQYNPVVSTRVIPFYEAVHNAQHPPKSPKEVKGQKHEVEK